MSLCSSQQLPLQAERKGGCVISTLVSELTGEDPDAGRGWAREEKGTTEGELAGWRSDSTGVGLGGLRELGVDRGPGVLRFTGSQTAGD